MTPKERLFVRHMAMTNNAAYSAYKAGYANPDTAGPRNMRNPALQEATKQQVERWLESEGAALGVGVLVELAIDKAQPGSVRVRAASKITDLARLGVDDAGSGKELHEMTGSELAEYLAKLERQKDAIEKALSDQAKPVIQHRPSTAFD